MKPTHPAFIAVLATLFLGTLAHCAAAEESLLPVFGTEGQEFKTEAKDNHVIRGWLPTGWTDNSEWAAVDVTYTKLVDGPVKTAGAVRIKVENTKEPWVQLTASGSRNYEQDRIYRVAGWVRSADPVKLMVCARQEESPYQNYHQQDLAATAEWKPFEFEFAPKGNIKAIVMFIVETVGTVDLAGITVTDEGSAK